MWWDVLIGAVFVAGITAFVRLTLIRSRTSIRPSRRSLDSIYPNYADSPKQQQRYADEHGGSWHDDENRPN